MKAFKWSSGYRINDISLNVFIGLSIADCINKEEFEKQYDEMNKLENGKIAKTKFYEYYCSLFLPGDELNYDYCIIQEPINENLEPIETEIKESNKSNEIILTKIDITDILKYLNKIQKILESKLK